METLYTDPTALKRLSANLQWCAIALVVCGVVVQVVKHLVDLRERSVSAALSAAKDQSRIKKEQELQVALEKSKQDYEQLSSSAKELQDRLEKAEIAAPKIDRQGRIAASPFVSYASEFSEGIAEARRLFSAGDMDGAFRVADGLRKRKDDFGLAYFLLGSVEAQRSHFGEAEAFLKKALSLGLDVADEAWCLHNLGLVVGSQGHQLKAIDYIKEAHKKAPNEVGITQTYEKIPLDLR
jgi:tetratricopeptide (TPR) repeat protein